MVSDILADLSGVTILPSDASSSFLEMGFDSLFLTQVAQALHTKFGLKITFRQLLGDQSSLKSLSEFIDGQLPAEALAPAEVTAPRDEVMSQTGPLSHQRLETQSPSNSNGSADESAVERLMREQMQAMHGTRQQQQS